jgi:hypothetical protein
MENFKPNPPGFTSENTSFIDELKVPNLNLGAPANANNNNNNNNNNNFNIINKPLIEELTQEIANAKVRINAKKRSLAFGKKWVERANIPEEKREKGIKDIERMTKEIEKEEAQYKKMQNSMKKFIKTRKYTTNGLKPTENIKSTFRNTRKSRKNRKTRRH